MNQPRFLTPKQAGEAFEAFTLPVIKSGLEGGHVGGTDLYLLALNPCVPFSEGAPLPILFEWYSSDKADWPDWDGMKFDDFAKAKAMISWRTGKSSKEVALMQPHLLLPGDTSLWGSDVTNGVISAASGAKPNFDEMFSRVNNAAMIAEANHYAEGFAQQEDKPDWL